MSGKAQQQSRIKELITRGREQGYLTYAEVNDHLPEDISDPEQVEDIIRMINDMGINVFESAPDADALMLADADTDEAAAEEAAAALAAVETDIGRTTDPVRMYMREMGTVELLTREGEIEIAKRIEEGIREVMGAIAHFPGTVDHILSEYTRVTTEGGRLSDVLSGYIDPDDGIAPPAAEVPPPIDPKAAKADDDDDDDDAAATTRKKPKAVRIRSSLPSVSALSDQMEITRKALKKHGRTQQGGIAELLALAELFMPIKLVPKQFEGLVERVRSALDRLRQQERAIMQLCVRDARMPRADFLRQFPGNEVDELVRRTGQGKANTPKPWVACSRTSSLPAEADRAETETGLTIAEIKDINRRMSIGEAKARRAKKKWSKRTCVW
jgi:RNA polymerase primary sigma factor